MNPAEAAVIGKLFEESDQTELPHLIGVSRRTLFSFHELYFHLVEADENLATNLYDARSNPLYADLNTKLAQHITPYSPTWREPKDAMATVFYSWEANNGQRAH